jgi:5-formyltetrahydrofolate cyclo-ligase
MRSLRVAITPRVAEAAALRAACTLVALPAVRSARRVALYAALPDELDTTPLLERLRECEKSILLPRIDRVAKRLTFHEVDRASRLIRGALGIEEPQRDVPAVRVAVGDVVVIPGLAFDSAGGRLGFGGGYYDRSLDMPPDQRPLLIGYGYEFQVVPFVPKARHDRSVDVIVTDQCVRWCVPTRGDEHDQDQRA